MPLAEKRVNIICYFKTFITFAVIVLTVILE